MLFQKKYEITSKEIAKAKKIAQDLNIEDATARILVSRGIDTVKKAKDFFREEEIFYSPMLLKDMDKCVDAIKGAVDTGKKITIYCDYDADGTTAGAQMYLCLSSKGANVDIYTPHRTDEGYGLNENAIEKILLNGTKLLIMLDCGIKDADQVNAAYESGINTVIIDHHECPETLPSAVGIVNPKQTGCEYPFSELCGSGLAFKVIHALYGLDEAKKYIDLAAVGTIGDIVPLISENRAIVKAGLKKLNTNPLPGLSCLIKEAGLNLGKVTEENVAFGLVSRINAASRMDSAFAALNLLMAEQEDEFTQKAAKQLCFLNKKRQDTEKYIEQRIEKILSNIPIEQKAVLVIWDKSFAVGVVGIAASYIAEKYNMPVIVFGYANGMYTGSARSINGINIHEALLNVKDILVRFGGHAAAAGMTVKQENIELFEQRINEYLIKKTKGLKIEKCILYDEEVKLDEINKKLLQELNMIKPFGCGNEQPVFYIKNANVLKYEYIGKDEKEHLRMVISKDDIEINAIYFGYKKLFNIVPRYMDMAFVAEINSFDSQLQMIVRGIKPLCDEDTLKDIINVNSNMLNAQFVKEVCNLDNQNDGVLYELLLEIENSDTGTLIIANTKEAFDWLMKNEVFRKKLEEGKVTLNVYRQYNGTVNTITFANGLNDVNVAKFKNVFTVGPSGLNNVKSIFPDDLRQEYVKRAKGSFIDRDELSKVYIALKRVKTDKDKRILISESFIKMLRISDDKLLFALSVFTELSLIQIQIDDKIYVNLKNEAKEKKNLEDSTIFSAFCKIANDI